MPRTSCTFRPGVCRVETCHRRPRDVCCATVAGPRPWRQLTVPRTGRAPDAWGRSRGTMVGANLGCAHLVGSICPAGLLDIPPRAALLNGVTVHGAQFMVAVRAARRSSAAIGRGLVRDSDGPGARFGSSLISARSVGCRAGACRAQGASRGHSRNHALISAPLWALGRR